MKTQLSYLVIKSDNVDSLMLFYSSLELEFVYHQHENGPFHYSTDLGGIVFEIYPRKSTNHSSNNLRLGFEVNSISNCLTKLKANGFVVNAKISINEWGKSAVFKDLEGNSIDLTEKIS